MKDFINRIYTIIALNDKDYLPIFKERMEEESYLSILQCLIGYTGQKEQQIETEHARPYHTDHVENRFKDVLVQCMECIIDSYEAFSDEVYSVLLELLCYRHWAYAFYFVSEIYANKLDEKERKMSAFQNQIYGFENMNKKIYMAFVEYCGSFYGSFYDNESSIRRLCKKYPTEEKFNEEEKDAIASALYMHVCNAGTPIDMGYAYMGIRELRENIHFMEKSIICKVLRKYTKQEVLSSKQACNQVFTLIDAGIKENNKALKFLYIDSIKWLEMISFILYEEHEEWEWVDWRSGSIAERTFQFLKIDGEVCEVEVGLEIGLECQSNQLEFHIKLSGDNFVVSLQGKEYSEVFKYEDYVLNHLHQKEYRKEVEKRLLGKSENIQKKGLTLLLAYIDNYRTLNKQKFVFDQSYDYDVDNNQIVRREKKEFAICYGNKVQSMHCVVGKNGVGKTSFVNFMCDVFLQKIIDIDTKTDCKNNEYGQRNYLDEKTADMKMLVVFRFDGADYMVTNIEGIEAPDIRIYDKKYAGLLSAHGAVSKLFYFSNKIDINTISDDAIRETLKHDYSAENSLRTQMYHSKESDKMVINKEFCYVFFFLKSHSDDELNAYLQEKDSCDEEIFKSKLSLLNGNPEEQELFQKCIQEDYYIEEPQFLKMLCRDKGIGFFSSGQYAKLNLLAKMYWVLSGYKKYYKVIEDLIEKVQKDNPEEESIHNPLYQEDAIDNNDSAMFFIDEGDIYYHPDWQRNFINDLVQIINKSLVECRVQVIIATNSPFMLSDVARENVITLPQVKDMPLTFGQNIHTLLRESFFMEYTMGEFSRNMIFQVFSVLEKQHEDTKSLCDELSKIFNTNIDINEVETVLLEFAENIGNEIFRDSLKRAIMEKFPDDSLEQLIEERRRLDERIALLEKKNDTNGKIY